MKFKFKMLTFIGLAALSMTLMAGDKGPTIVVKKDERKIAGLNTNGITRWTASVGQDGDEVTAVNQSGIPQMPPERLGKASQPFWTW